MSMLVTNTDHGPINYSPGFYKIIYISEDLNIIGKVNEKVTNCITAWDGYKELFSDFCDPFVLMHDNFAYVSSPSTGMIYVLTDQEFHMIMREAKKHGNDMRVVIQYCHQLCKKLVVI